ncbi:MAG: hypothetical protein BRC42_09950 [Cyanobacteria bacterium QS_1_48_34]|nr:MAG: hypothetical protein BRC42_09950 [Cyanobacteria bacterium QS_1_48_34]
MCLKAIVVISSKSLQFKKKYLGANKMSKTIVNLTELLVVEEINTLLGEYPSPHPYKSAFSQPELREKLMAFVIRKVNQQYAVINGSKEKTTYGDFSDCLSGQRSQIKNWVEKGMEMIFQDQKQSELAWVSQAEQAVREPSHWFG